jgi:putative Holliday junction resolvase
MINHVGRILGVDPGEKRIGLAISDPSQTIASPLTVIEHQSRTKDAINIVNAALEQDAVLIIVGYPDELNEEPSFQGRKSIRLKDELLLQGNIPVQFWNEYGSTKEAQAARRKMGVPRYKRSGHLDDLAATVILQSYLDSQLDDEFNENN